MRSAECRKSATGILRNGMQNTVSLGLGLVLGLV